MTQSHHQTTQGPIVYRDGNHWGMPGLVSAHSHAFQRALRGRTQRRQTEAGSFWSWRGLMYDLAARLDPDDIYHLACFAYAELAMSGVTAVGEFHYLHHARNGAPYDNRTELAEAVIRAAQEIGLRICLIRTAYLRGGYGQALDPAQQRFTDPTLEPVLQDVEALRAKFAADPLVNVAVAAHSIRAVALPQVQTLANYAAAQNLPFHMHVCEQRRELEECLAEYGATPVALLADHGILSSRFVGVHATHISAAEIEALGRSRSLVCLCRTTERDLGDGLPPTSSLIEAGVRLCVGVDSHAGADAFEEIRAVELDERSRLEARHAAAEAPALLAVAAANGRQALGLPADASQDVVYLNANDAALVGIRDDLAVDAVIFAATPRAVDKVVVGGKVIVENGLHILYEEIRSRYEATLHKLGLSSEEKKSPIANP